MFWLMLLGIYMGWIDAVYGKRAEGQAPDVLRQHDWYAPLPAPPLYLRDTYEVTGTGEKCDEYVRFWARSRR